MSGCDSHPNLWLRPPDSIVPAFGSTYVASRPELCEPDELKRAAAPRHHFLWRIARVNPLQNHTSQVIDDGVNSG